jgi:hypothetical protein
MTYKGYCGRWGQSGYWLTNNCRIYWEGERSLMVPCFSDLCSGAFPSRYQCLWNWERWISVYVDNFFFQFQIKISQKLQVRNKCLQNKRLVLQRQYNAFNTELSHSKPYTLLKPGWKVFCITNRMWKIIMRMCTYVTKISGTLAVVSLRILLTWN